MNKILFSVCLFMITSLASAQQVLVFSNGSKRKMIEVREGQRLSLAYKGYLGQTDYIKSIVYEITDSTVELGIPPELIPGGKNNERLISAHRIVRLDDIIAFRRITLGRQLLKTTLTLTAVVGSYFMLTELYRSANISTGGAFLISLGTGIAASTLINALLPENANNKLSDGWKLTRIRLQE